MQTRGRLFQKTGESHRQRGTGARFLEHRYVETCVTRGWKGLGEAGIPDKTPGLDPVGSRKQHTCESRAGWRGYRGGTTRDKVRTQLDEKS